jgi:hypothetical protein
VTIEGHAHEVARELRARRSTVTPLSTIAVCGNEAAHDELEKILRSLV